MSDKQHKYLTEPADTDKMPKGIPYIIGNEAAERFSFYGMKAILVVYMTAHLKSLDGSSDVMSEEDATYYSHLFNSAAYFFPILGALVSDWLLGKYRTIIALSLVYCLGHVALAMGDTNVGALLGIAPRIWMAIGLGLIAMGAGGIKPCVSAHVGDQFGSRNRHLMSPVFSAFYFSINLGAVASTFITPILLKHFGPSVAFGVPGGLMLLATFVFWMGRNEFIHVPANDRSEFHKAFSPATVKAVMSLLLVYVFVMVFWSLFDQTQSRWILQAKYMNRSVFGWDILPSQTALFNPLFVLLLIPLFSLGLYPLLGRFFHLTPLRKVGIGLFIAAMSFAISTYIESGITGGRVTKSTSSRNPQLWSANNLIQGDGARTAWLSQSLLESEEVDEPDADEKDDAQSIVLRLRERRAWSISSLTLQPLDVSNGDLLEAIDETQEEAKKQGVNVDGVSFTPQACLAKEVAVFVATNPSGPWTEVSRLMLPQGSSGPTEMFFAPVEAEYVKVDVVSNWGGPVVGLGEIAVNADGVIPSDASSDASTVWPNVVTIGNRPSIWWQVLAYLLLTSAEIMVSITCLEFSYTQAPRILKSFIMGLYLLSVSAGNLFTSMVNLFIQNEDGTSKLEGVSYYGFFTLLMLGTAIVFPFAMLFYRGQTHLQDEHEEEEGEGDSKSQEPAAGTDGS